MYAPSLALKAGSVGLALSALARAYDQVPPSAFGTLPAGADPAADQLQGMLQCTRVRTLTDSLLVATCNSS